MRLKIKFKVKHLGNDLRLGIFTESDEICYSTTACQTNYKLARGKLTYLLFMLVKFRNEKLSGNGFARLQGNDTAKELANSEGSN